MNGMNKLFDLQVARLVAKGTGNLSKGLVDLLGKTSDHQTATKGAGHEPPITHRYAGSVTFKGSLKDAMAQFDTFERRKLKAWKKGTSYATADGAFADYTATRRFNVKLVPTSYWGRIYRNGRSNQPRSNHGLEMVEYEYRTVFELEPALRVTRVSYTTEEIIDPSFSCPRDLLKHYEAPKLPTGFGTIGEDFLNHLHATGLV